MKHCSFKVAKAIKEAGYPQPQKDLMGFYNTPCDLYFTGRYSNYDEYCERRIDWDEKNELHTVEDWAAENEPRFYGDAIAAPTYLEIWLWLWREKKIDLQMLGYNNGKAKCYIERNNIHEDFLSNMIDPEEAIIAAIEYSVDNDLIK